MYEGPGVVMNGRWVFEHDGENDCVILLFPSKASAAPITIVSEGRGGPLGSIRMR